MATLLVALETRNFGELPHRSVEQIAYCNVKRAYGFKIDCFKSLSNLLESKYQVTAEGVKILLNFNTVFFINIKL